MIDVECPKCKSGFFDITNTDGGVEDGWMVFYCTCLEGECGCQFELNCNIGIKSVKVYENQDTE